MSYEGMAGFQEAEEESEREKERTAPSEFVFKHFNGTIITIDGWDNYREARRQLNRFTNNKKGFKLQKDA